VLLWLAEPMLHHLSSCSPMSRLLEHAPVHQHILLRFTYARLLPPRPSPQLRDARRQGAPSRGALPVNFVTGQAAPEDYLAGIDAQVGCGACGPHLAGFQTCCTDGSCGIVPGQRCSAAAAFFCRISRQALRRTALHPQMRRRTQGST